MKKLSSYLYVFAEMGMIITNPPYNKRVTGDLESMDGHRNIVYIHNGGQKVGHMMDGYIYIRMKA